MRWILFFTLLLVSCASTGLDETKLVDLTYPFNEQTIYWPTAKRFQLKQVAHGMTDAGYWYASNDYAASEHGGTHLDAPMHFARGRHATAEIPLRQLVGPACVIDIRKQCQSTSDYRLKPEDIEQHEQRYGPIPPGSVVLIHTGFGMFYPDAKRYLGSDVRDEVKNLHFPGIGEAAAQELVKRQIDLVGIDTASLDYGQSQDFIAHRVLNDANIPGLENVASLELLPPRGALLIALPMKIENGSGGPCRIVAVLP
ncbi:MAG: cyclase family protein [Planctomycetota bacterium]